MELYNVVTSSYKIHSQDLQHSVSNDLPLRESDLRKTSADYQWPQTTKHVLASKHLLISLWTFYAHYRGKMATRACWLGIAKVMLWDSQTHGFTWANKDKMMVLKIINNNNKQLYWLQKKLHWAKAIRGRQCGDPTNCYILFYVAENRPFTGLWSPVVHMYECYIVTHLPFHLIPTLMSFV